jgi:hypothetical protein
MNSNCNLGAGLPLRSYTGQALLLRPSPKGALMRRLLLLYGMIAGHDPLPVPAHGGNLMLYCLGGVSWRQEGSLREHARRRMWVLFLGMFVGLTSPILARAQQGTFSSIDILGSTSTSANGINDAGQIVGGGGT